MGLKRVQRPGGVTPSGESRGSNSVSPVSARKRKRMGPWTRLLLKVVIIGAVGWALFTYVIGVEIYHGENMYPFIMDGDLLVTYKLDPYNVGDVVSYRVPDSEDKRISRISVSGKHEVDITDAGELLMDGYLVAEKVFYKTERLDGSTVTFPRQMAEGEYFLLDDYRIEGYDSRVFGSVTEDAFLGKVLYVFRKRGI